jgi:hypothetical protein
MPKINCEKCGSIRSFAKNDIPPKCKCNIPAFRKTNPKSKEVVPGEKDGEIKEIGNVTDATEEKVFKGKGYEGRKRF